MSSASSQIPLSGPAMVKLTSPGVQDERVPVLNPPLFGQPEALVPWEMKTERERGGARGEASCYDFVAFPVPSSGDLKWEGTEGELGVLARPPFLHPSRPLYQHRKERNDSRTACLLLGPFRCLLRAAFLVVCHLRSEVRRASWSGTDVRGLRAVARAALSDNVEEREQ